MAYPRVVLHVATSADGSTLGLNDVLDLGMFYGLCARAGWQEDVALCGSETIVTGVQSFLGVDPSSPEDGNDDGERPEASSAAGDDDESGKPMLVVPDTRGRVKCWRLLRKMPHWRRQMVSVATDATPAAHVEYLGRAGVDVLRVKTAAESDHADLCETLSALRTRFGAKVVRVDSGGVLNGALLAAGLVDEVSVVVLPCIAGNTGKTFAALPVLPAAPPLALSLVACEQLPGGVAWLRYSVVRKNA